MHSLGFGGLTGLLVVVSAVILLLRGRYPRSIFDTGVERVSTSTYALTVEEVEIEGQGVGFVSDAVGPLRVQVTGADRPVFVGIAPHREVAAYLDGVAHDPVTHLAFSPGPDDGARPVRVPGRVPATRPGARPFWTAQAEGMGRQTLT